MQNDSKKELTTSGLTNRVILGSARHTNVTRNILTSYGMCSRIRSLKISGLSPGAIQPSASALSSSIRPAPQWCSIRVIPVAELPGQRRGQGEPSQRVHDGGGHPGVTHVAIVVDA